MKIVNVQKDVVVCPKCGRITAGEITTYKNIPFNAYHAECHHCGYTITESEYETPYGNNIIRADKRKEAVCEYVNKKTKMEIEELAQYYKLALETLVLAFASDVAASKSKQCGNSI